MQQISDEAYEAYLKERGLSRTQYTTMELLAVASAREVTDGAFVFAGTGLPSAGLDVGAVHRGAEHDADYGSGHRGATRRAPADLGL